MPPLPPELAAGLVLGLDGAGKRDRTRLQLLVAAIDVFSRRGVAESSIQEIASVAGVANGTVYNHFATREEVTSGVASLLAHTLCRRISSSFDSVAEGAERMAIGNRRYLWLAEQSPAWATLVLQVAALAPELSLEIRQYVLADLRLGLKQKAFKVVSEAAAMDLISGTVARAMVSIAHGVAPAGHASAVAAMVLRGLGMDADEAVAVAKRPLPPFPEIAPAVAPEAARASRARAVR